MILALTTTTPWHDSPDCVPEHRLKPSFVEEERGADPAWIAAHHDDGAEFFLSTLEACGQLNARRPTERMNR